MKAQFTGCFAMEMSTALVLAHVDLNFELIWVLIQVILVLWDGRVLGINGFILMHFPQLSDSLPYLFFLLSLIFDKLSVVNLV